MRYWWGLCEWWDQSKQRVEHVPVGPCMSYSECKQRCDRKVCTYEIFELDTCDRRRAVQELREKMNEKGKTLGECLQNFKHNINDSGQEIKVKKEAKEAREAEGAKEASGTGKTGKKAKKGKGGEMPYMPYGWQG